ncbi:hypothetical protein Ancab_028381 [Ancistrocladus abbreviatus]
MTEAKHKDGLPAHLSRVDENFNLTTPEAESLQIHGYECVAAGPSGVEHPINSENVPGEPLADVISCGNGTEPTRESMNPALFVGEQSHMCGNESEASHLSRPKDQDAVRSALLDEAYEPLTPKDLVESDCVKSEVDEAREPSLPKDFVESDCVRSELADEARDESDATGLVGSDCAKSESLDARQITVEQVDHFALQSDFDGHLSGCFSSNQIKSEPSYSLDCQIMLSEPSEREKENLIPSGDIQGVPAESCFAVSESIATEQVENCLSVEVAALKDPLRLGHENVDDVLSKMRHTCNVLSDCVTSRQFGDASTSEQTPSQKLGEAVNGTIPSEQPERDITHSKDIQNNSAEECVAIPEYDITDQLGPPPRVEELETALEEVSKNSVGIEQFGPASEPDTQGYRSEQLGTPEDLAKTTIHMVPGSLSEDGNTSSKWLGRRNRKTSATLVDKKYALRSSAGSQHSRSEEKPNNTEPSNLENASGSKGRRKRKKRMKRKSDDEFSRMRKNLRYILHKMHYEQNLVEAYSSEGWRGQSLEKLRPEKELQRAKASINRCKLKIRALFQQLDEISAEGRFPDSLYDSEGQIDSEDIFCAKCGTKDLSSNNDIILCDGACDRGFHQFCLDPPLQTEEIPPDDEGWLCPACDCKVDCIDLLNGYEGTKLSISDRWEKVFPEAAAAAKGQDETFGLPSDDSEDDDYDPNRADGSDDDDKGGESESTSDESGFYSASEDPAPVRTGEDQYLGLPSDDSEDNDYDPDAPDDSELVEQGSSSSDFTSTSEDLGASFDDNGTSSKDELPVSFLKPDNEYDDSLPVPSKRHNERLDYKKLYDETYGNASSDSSDDEEWMGIDDAVATTDGTHNMFEETRHTRKNKTSQNPSLEGVKQTLPHSNGGSSIPSSSGLSVKRKPYRKLGEEVTQKLYASFKENQYPDRPTKEKLAEELGLSFQQVDKWFGNARWSFNHSSHAEAYTNEGLSKGHTDSGKIDTKSFHEVGDVNSRDVTCNGSEKASPKSSAIEPQHDSVHSSKGKLATEEIDREKITSARSRKRKNNLDDWVIVQALRTPNKDTSRNQLQTSGTEGSQTQRKRKKSGS